MKPTKHPSKDWETSLRSKSDRSSSSEVFSIDSDPILWICCSKTLNAGLILISMSKGWCEYECPSRVEYIMIWPKQWYDMIYGLWYDIWYLICGIWCMTCFDLIWFHLIWYDTLYYVINYDTFRWNDISFLRPTPKPSFFVVIDSADVQYKWMKNAFTLALCIAGRWANPQ